MRELMTIGYEGLNTEQFIQLLKSGDVETVVDIRQLPLSRKPGFSKAALAEIVQSHNMNYIHMGALGCPKDIRNDYHRDRNWKAYTARFKSYLETQTDSVVRLADLAMNERCCLLCFEADPNYCHRLFVVERVAAFSGKPKRVRHLMAKDLVQTALLVSEAA